MLAVVTEEAGTTGVSCFGGGCPASNKAWGSENVWMESRLPPAGGVHLNILLLIRAVVCVRRTWKGNAQGRYGLGPHKRLN